MNGEDSSQVVWTAAIVRVLILWSACVWLADLSTRFGFWGVTRGQAPSAGYFLSPLQFIGANLMILIVSAVLFVVLWRFSLPAARYIWRSLRAIGARHRVSFSDLQVVAYTTLGLYLIVTAVPPLANTLMAMRFFAGRHGSFYTPARDLTPTIVRAVIQLVCGLFLFFNTGAVVRRGGGPGPAGEDSEASEP